jgi:hypothetical protein
MGNVIGKGVIGSLLLGSLLFSSPAYSQESEDNGVSLGGEGEKGKVECVHGVDLKSKYVTIRGISYSEGPVFHAFGNYRKGGLSFTHWYDVEPGKERPLKEIDLDLHYEREIGKDVHAKAGFMEVYLPYEDFLFLHSLYGEVGWEGPVGLAVYLDRDWWGEDKGLLGKIKIGKNFSLGYKIDLELATDLTYNHEDFKPVSGLSHASVSGSLSFDVGSYNVNVGGYYQEPLNRHFERQFWVGLGVTR